MPIPREAIGNPDFFDRMIPEYHRRYFEQREPPAWQQALRTLGVVAAIAGGAYYAFRSGMLREPIQRLLRTLGNIRSTSLHTLSAHLRYAAEPLGVFQGRDLPGPWHGEFWHRLSLTAKRLVSQPVVDAELVRRTSSMPTLFERLIQQRNRAVVDFGTALQELSGSLPDASQVNQLANFVNEWLRQRALHYDPQAEQALLRTIGMRHARVGELVRRGVIPRTPHVEQFLKQFPEFAERMADPYIFIDDAGQVVDLREFIGSVRNTLRSLEEDFGLPIVGFNPFRLFYGSQVLGLEEMPIIHVFHPRSRQPILTGNTLPLRDLMVYLGGEVYRVTPEGFSLVEQAGYLVPSRRGTVARLVREMSGIAVAEFEPLSSQAAWWQRALYEVGDVLGLFRQDVPPSMAEAREVREWASSAGDALFSPIYRFAQRIGMGPKARYYPLSGAFGPDEYLFMRSYRPIREVGIEGVYEQLRAGRANLRDVTTATLFPYAFFNRLNAALNRVGLGLPIDALGSASQIYWNLVLRRVLPIVAGIYYWQYLNYESENILGFQPEDALARMYIGFHADLAAARDMLGITEWAKHSRHLIPGLDQIQELPFIGPLLTWDRSAEETLAYYLEGVEPIRKGRYWPFSATPFTGERIERFVPTWTRRVLTDYEFTANVLGSPEDYFAHGLFPTPRYPLAPLNRFFFDPYWYERQMAFERPYPYAGGGFPELEEFPLIGPIVNATIGQLLRPRRRMHPEFWQWYEAQQQGAGVGPGMEGVSLAGVGPAAAMGVGVAGVAPAGVGPGVAAGGVLPGVPAAGAEAAAPGEVAAGGPAAAAPVVAYITPSGMIQPMRLDFDYADQVLEARLQQMSGRLLGMAPVVPAGPQVAPELLPEPGIGGVLGETYYGLTEMAGFYGFALTSLTGEYHPPELPTSLETQSYRRAFWALGFGGLFGETNEIFRRFVPRPQPIPEVPIRNLMPSWLPGSDYFINFQIGDPYRIPQGEMMLPGPAYEALYDVPEVRTLMAIPEIRALVDSGVLNIREFYSPLTRLEILANVAPWSEEYRRTSALVSQMPLSEEDRERAKRARAMARARRQAERLYPYRFRTADLTYETVTVERWLDNNRLIVREYPGHIIRLAGIHVPSGQDDPTAQRAREYLHRVAGPGARVTIGYTSDELYKFEDTSIYRPIRAVLIVGGRNINRELLASGLAKEREQDWTPAGVHARFSEAEIWFGSLMESLAHMDTPFHCIAPWTEVLTQDGWVKASDLKPGQMVLTHTGEWKPVVDVREQSPGKPIVDIKLVSSNIRLTVTYDHPILACRAQRKRRITSRATGRKLEPFGSDPKIEFVFAGDLKPYDFVVYVPSRMPDFDPEPIDLLSLAPGRFVLVGECCVTTTFRGGKPRTNGASLPRYLPVTPELARLMGYYASEGCIARCHGRPTEVVLTFGETEQAYVNDVARIVKSAIGIDVRVSKRPGRVLRVVIGSAFLAELMVHFVGEKHAKRAPMELLTSRVLRAEFVRGLLRGDGRKAGYAKYDEIALAAAPLIVWLRDALFDLWRIPTSISLAINRKHPLYRLNIGKYPQLVEFVDGEMPYRPQAFTQSIQQRDRVALGPYILYRIKSVTPSEYQGPTIDVEVADNDTFATLHATVHNTKFWQVRSPLEMYLRRDLYGQRFQQWQSPIESFLVPTLESYAMRPPPMAILTGAAFGMLFGQTGFGRLIGALAGATLVGSAATARWMYERITGERWIPPRRRLEWDVNEYLDILRTIRAARNFAQMAEMARRREGVDVRRILELAEAEGEANKAQTRRLEELKRTIRTAPRPLAPGQLAALLTRAGIPVEEGELLDEDLAIRRINERIAALSQRRAYRIGPYTAAALAAYRDMRRSMWAYSGGYLGDVLAALPDKERRYFAHFVRAPEREREEILRVTPPYLRRLLRYLWGQGLEPSPRLEEYFQRHALPPPEWPGWDPSVPWEAVQVAVIRQAGLDPREFGLWDEAERLARMYPVPVPKLYMDVGDRADEVRRRLIELLGAAGYRDLQVLVEPKATPGISIDAQILHDRRQEIAALLEQSLPELVGD